MTTSRCDPCSKQSPNEDPSFGNATGRVTKSDSKKKMIFEYPRASPKGEQMDFVEVISWMMTA